ncbi:hypothetical protein UFOVP1437_21 [uncultured Caudovirales phage]|uniref:Uncharacterized protein n=1 Tax=uncultured Caudovirales phage TaxID=2100421 RepID=A0A6J7XB76_9CAUD|nr:hypothetical protein UFOVP1437_21 [uncultured Caudovirales phage]CAB5228149.1 hypothetical protein UFOVP1531_43 [uncultured Caudovirales phage]
MASLKKAENDIYAYLNKRWRIGWSITAVTEFYNNLTYRQVIDEGGDMSRFFGIAIALDSKAEIDMHKYPRFTIKRLAEALANLRTTEEERRRFPKEPVITTDASMPQDTISSVVNPGTSSFPGKVPTPAPISVSSSMGFPTSLDDDFLNNLGDTP